MKNKTAKMQAVKRKMASFDSEVVSVVRQMFTDLTDAELKVYLGVCRKYQADPIMKEIVPIVFNTRKGRVLNFIMTKNFCLKVAHRSKEFDSLTSKLIRDEKGVIIGASAVCWKKGGQHPFEAEVDFKEYYNDKNDLWGKFPGAMIQKAAKVLVLKEAFGIEITSDIEVEKIGGMIQISDIVVPKTKFTISDSGAIKKEVKREKEEEIL